MTLISRYISWKFKLPPAKTHAVSHERDIPVKMPDGTILLADRYFPTHDSHCPVILMRSPYGRSGVIAGVFTYPVAERGFQVFIQSCRGTFGSGGDFYPFRDDRADGLATIEWLRQQEWYPGKFAMFGPSYLSYVQWAVADQAGPELKALIPIVTAAEFRSVTYPGESFALDTILSWTQQMVFQSDSLIKSILLRSQRARRLEHALLHLPLAEADSQASGLTVPFYQDWLVHNDPGDHWWDETDHLSTLSQVRAPVHLLGGFYDVLFQPTLDCYQRLQQAGRNPYLTIGPWTHGAPGLQPYILNETLRWLQAYLLDETDGLRRAPVRVYLMGANEWRDFDHWPPAGYEPQRWHLQANRVLSPEAPTSSEPDHYCYDPSDSTPSVGGSSLTANSGQKDNRTLENRQDVLVYTSATLDHDLEVVGPVSIELYIRSSLEYTDFFARLCDVLPDGKSINLCDGIVRLEPGRFSPSVDGVKKVEFAISPTANSFKRGHRVRVQVSSGAHPRYARNPGSGEPLSKATHLIPADQRVFHDPLHPSAIILMVK